jgi:peptide/nickel transport system substrate-binding protein
MKQSRRNFLSQSAGVATSLAIASRTWAQTAGKQGGTLTIGSQGMRTLNPAIQPGNATGIPGAQIFMGLVRLDEKYKPQPSLAKSWDVSKDNLTYRFEMADNVLFHDGRPVTAKDAAFSIQTVKAAHPFMSVMYNAVLESVRADGDRTVEIKLLAPFQGLLYALSSALTPILPQHVYSTEPIQKHPANDKPVGSGPYKFVEWKPREYLILERNEHYVHPGRPYFDRLVFKIIEDPLTRAIALEKGEIEFFPFSFVRATDVERLQKNPKLVVTKSGYEAIGPINYLEMNLRDAPLSDLRVRQAIAHAIDKNFITKNLHRGLSKPLDGPLHSGNVFYTADAQTKYNFDIAKANQLLDAAGLRAKGDGMRMQLTLDIPTFNTDSTQLVAGYLKSQLRRIGVDIVLRPSTDLADFANRVGQWNYQLAMNSTFNYPDPLIGVHRSFVCANIKKVLWANTEGYCNESVDAVLKKAANEPEFAHRKMLYAEFVKGVTNDLPFIWTNEEPYTTIYSKRLTGLPKSVWGALSSLEDLRWSS